MRILITGAGGFIGSHLMDAFWELIKDEDAVSNDLVGFDNWLTGHKNRDGVFTLDITNRRDLYDVANDLEPDVVIHCAASYSDPDKWHRDAETNVLGGINAALVAKHHGAHLIYFQTILPPVSSYAISKIAAEQYLRLSGVDLTVLRLANIYGPRNLSGPIPTFYKRLSEGQPCVVVDTSRDMLFIDDLVRAVKRVVEERTTGTFDMGSGVQTPIFVLYEKIMNELGLVETRYSLVPPDPDDVQGTLSSEKRLPGWIATTPLNDGIRMTVESYREHGVTQTHTHLRIGEKDAS